MAVTLVVLVPLVSLTIAPAGAQGAVCPPDDAERPAWIEDDQTGKTVAQAIEYFESQDLSVSVDGPTELPEDALVADWGVVHPDDVDFENGYIDFENGYIDFENGYIDFENGDSVVEEDNVIEEDNVVEDDVVDDGETGDGGAEAVLCAGTEVPDVRGLTLGEARAALDDALLVTPDYEADLDWRVVGQQPDEGTLVRYGTSVGLDVPPPAQQPQGAIVPPLFGLSAGEAAAALSDAGLELGAVTGASAGLVADQDPAAGVRVTPGSGVSVRLEATLEPVPDPSTAGDVRDSVADPEPGRVTESNGGVDGGRILDAVPTAAHQARSGALVAASVLAAVVLIALLALLGALLRNRLRGDAPRQALSRVRVLAVPGEVHSVISTQAPGPRTRVIHVEVRPDTGRQQVEDLVL